MTEPLLLYTNPESRGRIARWMLEEIAQPYRVEALDWGADMRQADFLALNPLGKVPTLVHGGVVVSETAAICAYLADAFPQAGLAPDPGSPERGAYYRWLFLVAGPLEAASTDRTLGLVVPREKRSMCGYGSFEELLDVIENTLEALGDEWLAGAQFTAADLYLAAQLGFMMQFRIVPHRPAYRAFFSRACARPAYSRASAYDDWKAG